MYYMPFTILRLSTSQLMFYLVFMYFELLVLHIKLSNLAILCVTLSIEKLGTPFPQSILTLLYEISKPSMI